MAAVKTSKTKSTKANQVESNMSNAAQGNEWYEDMVENVKATEAGHPFVGAYVICRGGDAGVHAGYFHSRDGNTVLLTEARRLWSWEANAGVALSGLAIFGLKGGKIDAKLPVMEMFGVCEILPCSPFAADSILNAQ